MVIDMVEGEVQGGGYGGGKERGAFPWMGCRASWMLQPLARNPIKVA